MNKLTQILVKNLSFNGRTSRNEFASIILNHLFNIILSIFLNNLIFGKPLFVFNLGLLLYIYIILIIIPFFALLVRRLHDVGKSSYNLMFLFLPIFGVIILFYFLLKEGDVYNNKYGSTTII